MVNQYRRLRSRSGCLAPLGNWVTAHLQYLVLRIESVFIMRALTPRRNLLNRNLEVTKQVLGDREESSDTGH
jgi:hypothetical protein